MLQKATFRTCFLHISVYCWVSVLGFRGLGLGSKDKGLGFSKIYWGLGEKVGANVCVWWGNWTKVAKR